MEHLLMQDAALPRSGRSRPRRLAPWLVLAALAVGGAVALWPKPHLAAAAAAPPPPDVTVATPLRQVIAPETGFLGQFSAVDTVELRAQVGGTLAAIQFTDGQIVHKGDLLFAIDARPFRIRLDQAVAQLHAAQARQTLSQVELWRAQQLRRTDFGTVETVDQRQADQRNADSAIDTAQAAIRDASLDLEFAQVVAPFEGRIGARLVSIGSLIAGSRGGSGPTTLLATLVSLDPIHLDFDMSEPEYLAWRQTHPGRAAADDVAISLDGQTYDHHGRLDFLDNQVDRSSGTIHARATVPNPDLSITPGQFAHVRVRMSRPAPALLIPDAALVADQSQEVVMTVAADGSVVPKPVLTGQAIGSLREIRAGLSPEDRVIIDGLPRARPGARVHPTDGTIPAAGGAS